MKTSISTSFSSIVKTDNSIIKIIEKKRVSHKHAVFFFLYKRRLYNVASRYNILKQMKPYIFKHLIERENKSWKHYRKNNVRGLNLTYMYVSGKKNMNMIQQFGENVSSSSLLFFYGKQIDVLDFFLSFFYIFGCLWKITKLTFRLLLIQCITKHRFIFHFRLKHITRKSRQQVIM